MLNMTLHPPCGGEWIHPPTSYNSSVCCYHYLLIIPVSENVYCLIELKNTKRSRLKLPLTHNRFYPLKRGRK